MPDNRQRWPRYRDAVIRARRRHADQCGGTVVLATPAVPSSRRSSPAVSPTPFEAEQLTRQPPHRRRRDLSRLTAHVPPRTQAPTTRFSSSTASARPKPKWPQTTMRPRACSPRSQDASVSTSLSLPVAGLTTCLRPPRARSARKTRNRPLSCRSATTNAVTTVQTVNRLCPTILPPAVAEAGTTRCSSTATPPSTRWYD